jgi:hypothetical protein
MLAPVFLALETPPLLTRLHRIRSLNSSRTRGVSSELPSSITITSAGGKVWEKQEPMVEASDFSALKAGMITETDFTGGKPASLHDIDRIASRHWYEGTIFIIL